MLALIKNARLSSCASRALLARNFASGMQCNKHTLVLIRHGESEWNKKNLFTGWHDVELSAKGSVNNNVCIR